jgi:hypothetical protein
MLACASAFRQCASDGCLLLPQKRKSKSAAATSNKGPEADMRFDVVEYIEFTRAIQADGIRILRQVIKQYARSEN